MIGSFDMDVFQRINKMYQVSVAEIEKEMLTYCLKGLKMIRLSNGVEISEATVVSALKKAGINIEPKHIFKAGDIAKTPHGDWRFIVRIGANLHAINRNGCELGAYAPEEGQEHFEKFNYKYAGRQSDLLKG